MTPDEAIKEIESLLNFKFISDKTKEALVVAISAIEYERACEEVIRKWKNS